MKQAIVYALSKKDTLLLKGIAICLMLWHHLFYQNPEYGNFVYQTAQIGKVCVSIFLFVSGYGLTVQYKKWSDKPVYETFKFQVKRFVKFYVNYWFVFILFVPLGVFIFNHPYNGGLFHFIRDILGVEGYSSYNVTWWFNQLIICMYLFFPLFYFIVRKNVLLFLIIAISLWKLKLPIVPYEVNEFLFVFGLGIASALKADKIQVLLSKLNSVLVLMITVVVLVLLCIQRCYGILPYFSGTQVDSFITLFLVLLVVLFFRLTQLQGKPLQYLGKHSINIYMIHTFIYYYFFPGLIYKLEYPILIFLALLASSLFISILIEYLKKIVHFEKIVTKFTLKIDKSTI